jgi:hypothetical protein
MRPPRPRAIEKARTLPPDAGELILDLRRTMVYRARAWRKLTRTKFAIMDQFWSEVASWNVYGCCLHDKCGG